MPTKTEVIQNFLCAKTHADLADLYNPCMEVQVSVAQDGGDPVTDEYKGKTWRGWSDGVTIWKPFRIPFNAKTDPTFDDTPIKWDFASHVEAIGMTGWDWYNRCSRWVAFDFDAITGHKKKAKTLTVDELQEVQSAVAEVPWITVRQSTGGHGLHLYAFLNPVATANHTEHAALGRAILGQLSALAKYDFSCKVDVCGGNMWVWHRKMLSPDNTTGLKLVKAGTALATPPVNWRDHLDVVKSISRRPKVTICEQADLFEQLAGQRPQIKLDKEHQRLLEFLQESGAVWWWDADYHMLVTHTLHLQEAHSKLGMKGFFQTNSSHSSQHNCFCFPLRGGAWGVRRYSQGVDEHESWVQDGNGWTTAYLNKEPTLPDVCRANKAIEDPKGGYVFHEAETAVKALAGIGVNVRLPDNYAFRETKVLPRKDGRIVLEVERKDTDSASDMVGWLAKLKIWTCVVGSVPVLTSATVREDEAGRFDDVVRHLVTEANEDYGWVINADSEWHLEPLTHVKAALASLGAKTDESTNIVGVSIFKPWKLVNLPFQPEYPGDRKWNKVAARFRFMPSDSEERNYPTWNKILTHAGSGLDNVVRDDSWCQLNGILTGADYLKCWIACMFQFPLEPLPYLFFYGPEDCGKSIFHEAINLLLTRGYARADAALASNSGFNGELEGAILCVTEETDLRKNVSAYNRIKDWVTARELPIHAKNKTPYHAPNTTHWVQCANDHKYCPVFKGDTRITMCCVPEISPIDKIPKRRMTELLEAEAPDFIAEVLHLELPESNDRLMLPVLNTIEKGILADQNQTPLQTFISEQCERAPGNSIKFSDFHDRFQEWLEPTDAVHWTKIRTGKELPPECPKGRDHATGQFYLGNICWKGKADPQIVSSRYILNDGYLDLIHDKR